MSHLLLRTLNRLAVTFARRGDLSAIDVLINEGADDIKLIASTEARYGHRNIVDSMIERGVRDYDVLAFRAAMGGQMPS